MIFCCHNFYVKCRPGKVTNHFCVILQIFFIFCLYFCQYIFLFVLQEVCLSVSFLIFQVFAPMDSMFFRNMARLEPGSIIAGFNQLCHRCHRQKAIILTHIARNQRGGLKKSKSTELVVFLTKENERYLQICKKVIFCSLSSVLNQSKIKTI